MLRLGHLVLFSLVDSGSPSTSPFAVLIFLPIFPLYRVRFLLYELLPSVFIDLVVKKKPEILVSTDSIQIAAREPYTFAVTHGIHLLA